MRSLGEQLSLEPAILPPLLKRLESVGYITRPRDAEDEQTLRVALTPAGRALRSSALKIPPAIMARLGMGRDELMELHAVLTSVIAHPTV